MSDLGPRKGRGLFRRRPPAGAAPGTVARQDDAHPTTLRVIRYGAELFEDIELSDRSALAALLSPPSDQKCNVVWIDAVGLQNTSELNAVATDLGIHRLLVEDMLHTHQRTKIEPDDDNLLIALRAPIDNEGVATDQVTLYLTPTVVFTIRERAGPMFDPVRQRIQHPSGRLRNMGTDYLTYALIDSVVDRFFPRIESASSRVGELEAEVLSDTGHVSGAEIHRMRQDVAALRRTLWPYKEALHNLQRDRHQLIGPDARMHMRDVFDHSQQLLDATDYLRDTINGVMDAQISQDNRRMNEAMKVLTMTSTMFIPLGFLAGLYGMNFDRMPGLHHPWGYGILMATMAALAIGMALWFRRQGWIGSKA